MFWVFTVHLLILSMYGSSPGSTHHHYWIVSTCCGVVHTSLLVWWIAGYNKFTEPHEPLLTKATGTLRSFLNDHREVSSQWQNSANLYLQMLAICFNIAFWVAEAQKTNQASFGFGRIFLGLYNICYLTRIFVVSNAFTQLVYSFWRGLAPINTYGILLLVFIYTFSNLAHQVLRQI